MKKFKANIKDEVETYSVVESKIAQHQALIVNTRKLKKFIIFSMRAEDVEIHLGHIKNIFEIESVVGLN